jgi:hypothetical protein
LPKGKYNIETLEKQSFELGIYRKIVPKNKKNIFVYDFINHEQVEFIKTGAGDVPVEWLEPRSLVIMEILGYYDGVSVKVRKSRLYSFMKHFLLEDFIKKGNLKLANTVYWTNFESSTRCSSKKLGLCEIADHCYSCKAEDTYHKGENCHTRQGLKIDILNAFMFVWYVNGMSNKSKYSCSSFRFCVDGDVRGISDISFAESVAFGLLQVLGINTYIYTHRTDLKLSWELCEYLVINISTDKVEIRGTNRFLAIKDISKAPKGALVCPCSYKSEKNVVCGVDCLLCSVKHNKTTYELLS